MHSDSEIVAAKRVLRDAGYLCVPREKVLRVGGSVSLHGRNWLTYGDDPSYVEAVRMDVANSMAREIVSKAGVVEWSTTSGPMPGSGQIVGIVAMLSGADAEDPIVSMIRETQTAK